MSKFIIACPVCHNYAEASTGFFASKHIRCACGNVINVKTDRMTTKVCPSCGNNVVYDQAEGKDAKCPVCKAQLVTDESYSNLVHFRCGTCGCQLQAAKNASAITCPVCDTVADVQAEIKKAEVRDAAIPAVINYEGDNQTFVWKHPIEDFNFGSQLIVHESQEAIFFKDGQALDTFGAGRYTLETQQLPLIEKLYKLPTDTEGTFHSEVYFINMTTQMAIKWGTPDKVRFIDPLTGTPLEIGASGEMNIKVSNSKKLLLKLVGTMKGVSWDDAEGCTKSLQAAFRPLIANAVKRNLSSVIKEEAIDLLEIDERLDLISERLRSKLLPGFEEYGITIPQFYVTNVVLPENDPNFKRIRELHTITLQTRIVQAEATVKTAQAQSEQQYRTAQEQSRAAIEIARREAELQAQTTETEIAKREAERKVIAAQAEAQAQRMAGLAEAEIMAAKGYNQRDVIQAEVQKAYAEGIGNMGPAVSAGGGGMMGDILGLGVGIAAAKAVSPQIGTMMQGFNLGAEQPSAPAAGWDCPTCGQKGITFNFCPNCGTKKPEENAGWDCPTCGQKGITFNFCPNCGTKKPEKSTWDCPDCGTKDISFNFCPNCGHKKA